MSGRTVYFLLGVAVAVAAIVALTPGGPVTVRVNAGGELVTVSGPSTSGADTGPVVTPTPTPVNPESRLDTAAIEWAIHRRVNEIRASRGLGQLRMSASIRAAARNHSRDMAANGFLAHEGSDGSSFHDRFEAAGVTCRVDTETPRWVATGAENVAFRRSAETNETAIGRAIVEQWMNSRPHRENILTGYWRREGVGVAVAPNGTVYATQNFC